MTKSTIVRGLVWLYFVLLVWEGALRKWLLPGWSDVLFLLRDPVVLGIYAVAIQRFPWRSRVVVLSIIVAVLGVLCSVASQTFDVVVMFYGLRVNFLHLPLLFVIPCYFDRDDVLTFGKWFMIFSFPVIVLMAFQFDSTFDSVWNVGVGGTAAGQLLAAVGDKARSSGPFSFVTGPVLFFPIATAFVLNALTYRGQANRILAICAGAACVLAVPVSISRSLLMGTIVTLVCYGIAVSVRPQLLARGLRTVGIAVLLLMLVSVTRLYQESSGLLGERWRSATVEGGGFMVTIVGRMWSDFRMPLAYFADVPFFGYGLGVGTNAGSKILTGVNTFLLPEGEWGRIMFESGPLLGLSTIALRVAVGFLTLRRSWRRLQDGDLLPFLLWSACALNLINGQWGPSTSLGFAVLGGGLVLAACRPTYELKTIESSIPSEREEDILTSPTSSCPVSSRSAN